MNSPKLSNFSILFIILLFYGLSIQGFERNVITSYHQVKGKPYSISYDRRSLRINDQPVLLFSGSLHYPRATQTMWDNLMKKAKVNGLNCIHTYVFWNYHEKRQGIYDFSGRGDLELFLQLAAKNDLFVDLRIGPYICAEWDFGGIPVWVRDLPGIKYRTYNPSWLKAMQKFVTDIVNLVRPYLASNGGPIILAQIENEYQGTNLDARKYVQWCGDLIDSLNTQIPWIMCNGDSANNTIETCNGCYCDSWVANHWKQQPDKPAFWTEDTEALRYELWGYAMVERTVQDVAWAVSRFIQVGGSYNNYYMWYGGNNYGSTGASGMSTKYGNGTIIHHNGIINEPKFTHMGKIHKLFLNYADVLVGQAVPEPIHLKYWNGTDWISGTQQEAYIYKNATDALILISSSSNNFVRTLYNNKPYDMAPLSIVMLDESENIIFNTSKVEQVHIDTHRTVIKSNFVWKWWNDRNYGNIPTFHNSTPVEQLALTHDESDYLFYTRNISVSSSGQQNLIVTTQKANGFLAFVDGRLQSHIENYEHDDGVIDLSLSLQLNAGEHELTLLSVSLGLFNLLGSNYILRKGIVGNVTLKNKDITSGLWTMQPKLAGEWLKVYTLEGSQFVIWNYNNDGINTSLTWYQTTFKTPTLDGKVILLRISGLNRGHIYLNGYDVAHYWTITGSCAVQLGCTQYVMDTCGQPTQIEYHLPPDWFTNEDNLLTIFEEIGGNPKQIELISYDDILTQQL